MKSNRFIYFLLIALACLILSACAQQSGQTQAATSAPVETTLATNKLAEPITLHLAVSDQMGVPSESSVLDFIEQVRSLSKGAIIIEPVWEAGGDAFESGVVAAVRGGQYDLGLAASRGFEKEGITTFQPLQAPFLIDNDALAVAVATSDVARQMLDRLPEAGLAGLAIWPEDLRHPFSVIPGKSLLAPEDYSGETIRITSEGITTEIIEALGGNPEYEADNYQGAESGLRQGYTLMGLPTATGNVVFFPKYQVLFVNGAAFNRLDKDQQAIILQAAAAVQTNTIAERPNEVEAGEAWCADGGSVVLASDDHLAAIEKAVQPIFDRIEQDPSNAATIAAIRDLKAKTSPSPGAPACAPAADPQGSGSIPAGEEWSVGLPPNGTWTVNLTLDDVIEMGVLKSNAPEWAGINSYEFKDGKGTFHGEFLDGAVIDCAITYKAVDDFFRLTLIDLSPDTHDCESEVDDLQWRLDADGLHFHVLAVKDAPLVEITAIYEAKPYQKVETWSEGPPPEGVWTVELTADDFAQAGVLRSVAQDEWAGSYTFTFEDGDSHFEWQGEQYTGKCQATYEPVDDFVRFTYYTDADDCTGQIDEVRWRVDQDGLHWEVISIRNAPAAEFSVIYQAKPWVMSKSPGAGANTQTAPPTGNFDVNGQSMYIKCLGSGTPTIILEPGEGGTHASMYDLQKRLSSFSTTCAYDRRRTSGTRTAQEVVDDLHGLLESASVNGPYVLLGSSAGGLFVQLYGRVYPEEVAGVVAMNPVPPAHPWLDEVSEIFSDEDYAGELAYFRGINGESFDYLASSDQLAEAGEPPDVPFEMVVSTIVQCEGEDICVKSYPTYKQILREVTSSWPRGNFSQLPAGHLIDASDPDAVVAIVERVLASQ